MIEIRPGGRDTRRQTTRSRGSAMLQRLQVVRGRTVTMAVTLALLAGAAGCSSDDAAAADASLPDAVSCPGAVCGYVTYSGAYTGPAATVYLRLYKETGSVSDNPVAAVGDPDFSASRLGEGEFQVDVSGYEGNLYLSAFLDVDVSGELGGPSGHSTATDGVYSDPIGAYGGYTFEAEADSWPTPIPFTSAGVSGIDIQLSDTGVITGVLHQGGGASGTVVVGAFEPVANGKFLHHTHAPSFSDGMVYHLVVPPGDHWRIRANVGDGTVGFYPTNPPPAPPANATPVDVTADAVTTDIDITVGGS